MEFFKGWKIVMARNQKSLYILSSNKLKEEKVQLLPLYLARHSFVKDTLKRRERGRRLDRGQLAICASRFTRFVDSCPDLSSMSYFLPIGIRWVRLRPYGSIGILVGSF